MPWVASIYGTLVVITAVAAMFKGAVWPGVTGLIGPAFCWWGGCGLYGSFTIGTLGQKIAGLILGIVCLLIGIGLLAWSGFRVTIFSLEIGGVLWGGIGFAIGLFTTPRSAAVGTEPQELPATFLDHRVPSELRASAEAALRDLRLLGATGEEMREILSVPRGASAIGAMQGLRQSNPEWVHEMPEAERRPTVQWLITMCRETT